MKEDRDLRMQTKDEPVGNARFGLRKRARAGILLIAGPSCGPPAVGEVAVEINAAGILARTGGCPIWVEVGQDPQIDALRDGQ
jgi:hypothetical protein